MFVLDETSQFGPLSHKFHPPLEPLGVDLIDIVLQRQHSCRPFRLTVSYETNASSVFGEVFPWELVTFALNRLCI